MLNAGVAVQYHIHVGEKGGTAFGYHFHLQVAGRLNDLLALLTARLSRRVDGETGAALRIVNDGPLQDAVDALARWWATLR